MTCFSVAAVLGVVAAVGWATVWEANTKLQNYRQWYNDGLENSIAIANENSELRARIRELESE
ncbi:MAG: hypothetical protein ACR2PR_08845 [Pseudohongiellaceae bacterium]